VFGQSGGAIGASRFGFGGGGHVKSPIVAALLDRKWKMERPLGVPTPKGKAQWRRAFLAG
jgi:hypothetical protein